jgi:hypothetical protein
MSLKKRVDMYYPLKDMCISFNIYLYASTNIDKYLTKKKNKQANKPSSILFASLIRGLPPAFFLS